MGNHRIGIIAGIISATTWACVGIFVNLLPAVSPISIVVGRCIVALLGTVTIILISKQRRSKVIPTLQQKTSWHLSILMLLYYLFAVTGFQMTPVTEVALMLNTSPLFILTYKKIKSLPIKKQEANGALLATVGVLIIMIPNLDIQEAVGLNRLIGNVLGLLASGAIALYAGLYPKKENDNKEPDVWVISALTFLLGVIILPIWSISTGYNSDYVVLVEQKSLITLIALGLLSTVLPTITYGISAKNAPPIITTTLRLLNPIFASILALFILDQIPSLWIIPGGLLVISGLLLMTATKKS